MPVPVVSEPISRVPTRETVSATLRAWIIDGTLAPGEVLRDAGIANAFGVSRTPVREALLQLEYEGLVESQPGRWTRVTPLDPAQLMSLYPVWAELETLGARLAATAVGNSPHLATANEAALAFATAVDTALAEPGQAQTHAIREADARFHDAMLAMTGNPLLVTTLTTLRLSIRRYECACPRAFTLASDAAEEHAQILAAVSASDPNASAHATRAHLQHGHRHLCAGWGIHAAD